MSKKRIRTGTFLVASAAALGLLTAALALAQDTTDPNECIAACMADSRTCEQAAHEAAAACITGAGCDALVAVARTTCRADRESDECAAARAAAKECLQPCRSEEHAAIKACRDATLACLNDNCGIDGLPPRCGRGRPGPPGPS